MSEERRQHLRMSLAVPVRVQGHEPSGASWEEMASVKDASPAGAALLLKHPVARGQVLLLSLPMPKRFRAYDVMEASYRVYALVRAVVPDGTTTRVGVMFLGKTAPRGFEKDPGGHYLLPTDRPPAVRKERRQHRRLEVYVNLKLRRPDDGGPGLREEQTIAENIGKGGARVLTSMPLAKGDVVELEEVDGSFRTRAEVKNIFIGNDRISRLNLQFLDTEAPARLTQD